MKGLMVEEVKYIIMFFYKYMLVLGIFISVYWFGLIFRVLNTY